MRGHDKRDFLKREAFILSCKKFNNADTHLVKIFSHSSIHLISH